MNLQLLEGRIGEGTVREFGMDVYTLLYFKWIINKDLLFSIWKPDQWYVAAWMRVWGKIYTCIPMAIPPCSPEIITTLLVSYTSIQNKKVFFKKKKKKKILTDSMLITH